MYSVVIAVWWLCCCRDFIKFVRSWLIQFASKVKYET